MLIFWVFELWRSEERKLRSLKDEVHEERRRWNFRTIAVSAWSQTLSFLQHFLTLTIFIWLLVKCQLTSWLVSRAKDETDERIAEAERRASRFEVTEILEFYVFQLAQQTWGRMSPKNSKPWEMNCWIPNCFCFFDFFDAWINRKKYRISGVDKYLLCLKWDGNIHKPPSRKVRQVCLYRDIAGRIARIQVRSPVKAWRNPFWQLKCWNCLLASFSCMQLWSNFPRQQIADKAAFARCIFVGRKMWRWISRTQKGHDRNV